MTTGTPLSGLPDECEVLIVGAGPSGLALALELASHGRTSLVIERRTDVDRLRPRAKATSARTMSHFRRWGVASSLREASPFGSKRVQDVFFRLTMSGPEIARLPAPVQLTPGRTDYAPERGLHIPQPILEQTLRRHVAGSKLSQLVLGLTVRSVTRAGGDLCATVEDSHGSRADVRAPWLVGCDGTGSRVRREIGVALDGDAAGIPNVSVMFRAPGLRSHGDGGHAFQTWIMRPRSPGMIGPLDDQELWWAILPGRSTRRGCQWVGRAGAARDV
jgi:2-polyprenyl-6-methoxyphenol hydroxylase-like FAD-dependent oxidoreductase